MQQLKWACYRWKDKLGITGITNVLLAILVLGFWLLALLPAKQHLEQLKQQARTTPSPNAVTIVNTPAARKFLETIPPASNMTAELQTIFDTAAKHGLDLGEVTYKRERKSGEKIERYHVSFSLDAPYPKTKVFLQDTLAALPYVALDQLTLNRDTVESETVFADIRLTLLMVHP